SGLRLRRTGAGRPRDPEAGVRQRRRGGAEPPRAQRTAAGLEAGVRARRGAYRPRRRPRRLLAWLRAAGWLALVVGSLFLVTWRQTRGLEPEAALRDLETRLDLAEAERIEHV